MLLRLDDDVIHIDVDVSTNLWQHALLHAPLECRTGVLQTKRHGGVAVDPEGRDEGGLQVISWIHLDLMVA